VIRGAWCGMYNSGNNGATCRFYNSNDNRDKTFKQDLDSILQKTSYFGMYLKGENKKVYDQLVSNFLNDTYNTRLINTFVSNDSNAVFEGTVLTDGLAIRDEIPNGNIVGTLNIDDGKIKFINYKFHTINSRYPWYQLQSKKGWVYGKHINIGTHIPTSIRHSFSPEEYMEEVVKYDLSQNLKVNHVVHNPEFDSQNGYVVYILDNEIPLNKDESIYFSVPTAARLDPIRTIYLGHRQDKDTHRGWNPITKL